MSAKPQFSATLNPNYVDGLVFYKDQAASVDFSKIITILRFTNEPIPDTSPVLMTITGGPTGLIFPADASFMVPNYAPNLHGTPTVNGTSNALIKATVYREDGTEGPVGLQGSCYFALPIIVQDAPTAETAGTAAVSQIILGDQSLVTGRAASVTLYTKGDLYTSTWRVTGLPDGMGASYSTISGTPTTPGEYSVTVTLTYKMESNTPPIVESKTVTFTVTAGAPVIATPGGPYDGYYAATAEIMAPFSLQLSASGSPTSWAMVGAPNGLSISNGGLISGSAVSAGVYLISVTATNAIGVSPSRMIQLTVTDPSEPSYVKDGAVDVFFDLQTRALSLTPPKVEAIINEGQTILNAKDGSTLMLKSGETLWLNLRFVKGTRVIDPVATGIRFGVACQVGGPLIMEGSAFTKVGSGSATYHKLRVPISDAEFSSITGDYYDEDKVETPDVPLASSSDMERIKGLCEIELTTGNGETIAKIKSDTMPVILSRSILP